MNEKPHEVRSTPEHSESATQVQLGAGTFTVTRTYTGTCPVKELMQQRVQQAAQTATTIDEGIGKAV